MFDVLGLDGESTLTMPYLTRRAMLHDLDLTGKGVAAPPHWVEVTGESLLAVAREHGLEGVIAKRADSIYQPGRRSPAWVKTPLRNTTEAVIAGWVFQTGSTREVGSLILGAHDPDGHLVYIGHVGTGFTATDRRQLLDRLRPLERDTSPLTTAPPPAQTRDAHYVDPILLGDVEYREYTGAGLRHPSWKGLRTDKTPNEITTPPARPDPA